MDVVEARSKNMEKFCRRFLSHHTDYEHLYEILENYSSTYAQMDNDSFHDRFKRICYMIINTWRNDHHHRSYILAILGWAQHVNEHYNTIDWYDTELLVTSLVEILNYINFDPSNFCKNSSCILL